MTMYKCLNFLIRYILPFLFLGYIALFFYFSLKTKNNFHEWLVNANKYLSPTLLTLVIAYALYIKASGFFDISSLLQISDKCLTTEVKAGFIERDGKFLSAHVPTFINQGGDAFAYEELLNNYIKTGNKNVKKYLNKIYDNTNAASTYFKITEIHRSKGTIWKHSKTGTVESSDDFDIPNVIDQLNEPNYWGTRATCALYLSDHKYLLNEELLLRNKEALRDYKWERLFENLVKNITSDSSLFVRVKSLATYNLLACNNNEQACQDFTEENIYHFNKIEEHWKNNKPSIMQRFRKE